MKASNIKKLNSVIEFLCGVAGADEAVYKLEQILKSEQKKDK